MTLLQKDEMICLQCDGDGMLNGHVCKSCNGHGIVVAVEDRPNHLRVTPYSPTPKMAEAIERLGKE